ncbi:EamA family transporter [Achromobacter spanius]|uniref:EamA family transporter n=1 Tax=Achromobacter spanius TaxID=217203 RepID=UPI001319CAC1|nr:EamA family transporter [Achromobacter spanius]
MNVCIGIALVMVFNILQAISAVFLASFLQYTDTTVVLLGVFSIIGTVCFAVSVRRSKKNYLPLVAMWPYVVAINITTAVSWGSFFVAVEHIEPALSSAFINSILPLSTIVVDRFIRRVCRISYSEILVSISLMVALAVTATTVAGGYSGGRVVGMDAYAIGIFMSGACGVAMAFTNVVSKKLNDARIDAGQIMSIRFLLLIVLAAVLVDERKFVIQVTEYWPAILFVAIVGNLIPIFSLQMGIQRLQPATVAFLIGLAPLIFFGIQSFSQAISFSWMTFLCVLLTTAVILIGTVVSTRNAKRNA